ncbi:MAG: helix-turn-helix domain-containing protein [Candidatus Spyradosoma sp.]
MSTAEEEVKSIQSIGARLRSAREKLALDERGVSDRTHIRRHYIIAMENDDFDSIDLAPVYRVGFLRIYAKLLKLDADALVAEYKEMLAKNSGGRGGAFRLVGRAVSSGDEADDSSFSGGVAAKPAPAPKALALVAALVLVVAAGVLVAVKSCASSDASSASAGAVAAAENGVAYEIELVSNANQKITIQEDYSGWDAEAKKPIAGAVVLDEYVPAGRGKKLTVHGTIFVREEQLGGCEIKYPSEAAFRNAAPGKTVVIAPNEDARKLKGTKSASWIINPQS